MSKLGFSPTSDGMATRFKYTSDLAFPAVDLIWVNDETFDRLRGEIDAFLGVRVITFEA